MGVHGLWKLIEPSGQIVPLETLAGKVLAVDVSIWLHQAVKGMQDAQGAPVAVAHLLILFHRICKLLFYKIKPVFVFDGGIPALKRQTIAARRQRTSAAKNEAVKVREKLIKNLLKHEAVRQMLSNETASAALGLNSFTLPGPSVEEDLYKLPPIAADYVDSESEIEETTEEESEKYTEDIHSVDVTSPEFLSLPPEVRHDILTELIETRKQSSWKHLDSMPNKSDSFSDFQMNRLLKRHAVQTSLEKAGKEMGGRTLSLKELESLLGEQGVLNPKTDIPSRRIAQDNVTRYMLVQKDSTEKNEKQFDINKHLEDVGWSSESDTDIILERTSKRQKKYEKSEPLVSSAQSVSFTEISNSSLPDESKFRIVNEVAEILSTLEHENVTSDATEKIEILKSETNLDKHLPECSNEIYSEVPIYEGKYAKQEIEDYINTKKSINESEEGIKLRSEIPGQKEINMATEVKNKATEKTVNSGICTSQCLVESKDDIKSQLAVPFNENKVKTNISTVSKILVHSVDEEIEIKPAVEKNNNFDVIKEKKPENIGSQSPAKQDTFEDTQELLVSSSDSENDFVPINTTDEKQLLEAPPQNTALLAQTSDNSSNPITIVINPLKSDTKDDIFAEIFVTKQKHSENVGDGDDDRETQNSVEGSYDIKTMVDQLSANDVNLKKILEQEHEDLIKEKGKQERQALNPTDQMYSDAQEMLRLFGIPFVVAPMEAEAQCAALNTIGLTEGTITDDSDIWLFGGQVVYKNFFNQTKHVLEYRSENIQKYFKLTREEMIKMALLVGSDYTVGLSGIGPVTALEILAAFQAPNQGLLDGLQNFRDWFIGQKKNGPQRIALRKKIKKTVMLPGFPNRSVVEAYLSPEIDDSKEPFSWAKPNVEMIRKYVKARLGWSSDKCNELLRPVLKKLEEATTQSTIQRHFKIIQKQPPTKKIFSKRIEKALRRLGNDSPDVEELEEEKEEEEEEQEQERRQRRRKRRKPKCNFSSDVTNISTNSEQNNEAKTERKTEVLDPGNPEKLTEISQCSESSKIKLINQKLHQNVSVPQKELSQKILKNRKEEAIKIFRTFKKGRKKTKVYAKEKVALSESSSEDD